MRVVVCERVTKVLMMFLCTYFGLNGSGRAQNALVVLEDPLTISSTVGKKHGGMFTAEGWVTQERTDYIQYDIETISSGEIEFDVRGFYASNVVFPNLEYDEDGNVIPGGEDVHYSFFCMWDRDESKSWYGKYVTPGVQQWHNPYKCYMHIYGYSPGDQYKWRHMKLRLNVAAFSGGYDDDPHAFEDPIIGPFDWEQDHTYHHHLVWGNGHMRWFMDGVEIKHWDYSSFGVEYAPPYHSVRIGSGIGTKGSSGFQCPRQITYSNVRIVRYEDHTPPQVVAVEPTGSEVALDSDVKVTFSESMEQATTESAFSIEPSVDGRFEWSGGTMYFNPAGLLSPNTQYSILVSVEATDLAGNPLSSDYAMTFLTAGDGTLDVVERYGIFDIPVVGSNVSGNKYTNVWVKGNFQGPSQTIEIDGFWDGGNVWRVRMAPTEVGNWRYTITSSRPELETAGSFQCVPSANRGFIKQDPDHPYAFAYEDGTPWLWKGETSWRGFTQMVPFEARYKPYIDKRAAQGFNAVQSILVSFINGLGFWKNEGGLIFEESATTKNYDKLNPGYFHWVDKRIEYALSKGVVPVILFTWAQEFVKFNQVQFERFEKYIVARYAAYNVFWCISGEYNEVYGEFGLTPQVWEHHGQFVHQLDPYDHPITLHPTGRTSCSEFGDREWLGFIMQQSPYWHRDISRDRRYSKPVVNAEYGYAGKVEDEKVRRGAWEIVTGGGYFSAGFLTTYAPDKGGWDLDAYGQQALELGWLFRLMDETHWWEMEPHDALVSNGYCVANPGKEYLVYSRDGGGVQIDLSDVQGLIPIQWLNPRDGAFSDRTQVQGGGSVTLVPPFSGDWALHVGEGAPRDSIPPNPPTDLVATALDTESIELTWNEPLQASDGDFASSYRIVRDDELLGVRSELNFTDHGLEENSTHFYQVFAVDDKGNTSLNPASVTATTLADDVPPQIVSASLSGPEELVVEFSEAVEGGSATLIENYYISPTVGIRLIEMTNVLNQIKIITDPHVAGIQYTLHVSNVKDHARSPNTIAANSTIAYHWERTFRLSNLSPNTYRTDSLQLGDRYYVDRDYTLVSVPEEFKDCLWILTENDDKDVSDPHWLSFDVNQPVTVRIAYDRSITSLPQWLLEFSSSEEQITTTDDSAFQVYTKSFAAGSIVLGGNSGNSSGSMYVVILKSADRIDQSAPQPPSGLGFVSE